MLCLLTVEEQSASMLSANPEEVSGVTWMSEEELANVLSTTTAATTSPLPATTGSVTPQQPPLTKHDFTPWVRGLHSTGYLPLLWRRAKWLMTVDRPYEAGDGGGADIICMPVVS